MRPEEFASWLVGLSAAGIAPSSVPPRQPRPVPDRLLLVLSCDYREPLERGERCSCEGELARCRAGRSLKSDLTVSRHECELCARGRLDHIGL